MDIFEWFGRRFSDKFESLEHGWIGSSTPKPPTYGSHYVQVRLTDFAIADARRRFRERKAAFQSVVTVTFGTDVAPVPSTVGPDSMSPLGVDDFVRLTHSNVALTGWLPFNSGNIDILGGLISAPGESDLEVAAGFLGKLSGLVKLPQLSTAINLATTVANGAADLLGGEDAEGIIGVQLGIGLGDLRDGYYLAIEPQLGQERPSLELFDVFNSRLVAYQDTDRQGRPGSMDGWNYLVLEVRTTETIGDAWRELDALSAPLKLALDRLGAASTAKQRDEARSALLSAMQFAKFCTDLTAGDRKRVVTAMEKDWDEALGVVLDGGGGRGAAFAPESPEIDSLSVAADAEEIREFIEVSYLDVPVGRS